MISTLSSASCRMDLSATLFAPTGTIQTYLVPATGGYLIEAGGAQAPEGDGAGARGDRVKGMFYLNRGDILKIVVGSQQPPTPQLRRIACGGEGGSVVWRGVGELPLPAKLMLTAGGGYRERPFNPDAPRWGASFNAGAFQSNTPAAQSGDGFVAITSVSEDPDSRPGASVHFAGESTAQSRQPSPGRAARLS